MRTEARNAAWPDLRIEGWQDTLATLHMWTQVVGKVALALTPLTNHFWNVTMRVTSSGLATQPIVTRDGALTMSFDFIRQELVLDCSNGRRETQALVPRTVADFHANVMQALERLGIGVRIWTTPVEVPDPIPFEKDTIHRTYDPEWANALWRALLAMQPVFEDFRARFLGKCSPVHFFWGSFDVAVTRFSGRRAPERPDADAITREAYSHEVISHGFWPGGSGVPDAAFYAYAAPEPEGLRTAPMRPAQVRYDEKLRIFILPYEAVRTAASPERALMEFLESTYENAARLASWSRSDLER